MQDEPTDPASDAHADDRTGPGRDGVDPVQVGLEQFQRAALEAIRAGRAMLDAAESILQDPRAAETVVRTVGTVARTATEAVAGFTTGLGRDAGSAGRASPGDGDGPGDDAPDGGFERISVD